MDDGTALVQATTGTNEGGRPARSNGRPRTLAGKPAGSKPSLGDQVLALAIGKTQQEITSACKGVRPNHVGVVKAASNEIRTDVPYDIAEIALEALKAAVRSIEKRLRTAGLDEDVEADLLNDLGYYKPLRTRFI